jgi:tetratricopeptide (TPR) repeat protein
MINRAALMLTLTLLAAFVSEIYAQRYPDSKVDSLWISGIYAIMSEDYSEAEQVFNRLEHDYPHLPLGPIYLAAVEIVKAYDYGLVYNDTFIRNKLSYAIRTAEENIENNGADIWDNYFLGLANAYSAYYAALLEDWYTAFDTGLESINAFEECLQSNPDFYEAAIAVCSYKYWKSVKMDWLPFVEDERNFAVSCLEKNAMKSTYNKNLAINSLVWIYIDSGSSSKAVELIKPLLLQFPDNRFFRWGLARAYEDLDEEKAIATYNELLKSYNENGINSTIQFITIKHKIAQNYFELGEYPLTLSHCTEILSITNLSKYEKNVLEERLDRVIELRDNAVENISDRN